MAKSDSNTEDSTSKSSNTVAGGRNTTRPPLLILLGAGASYPDIPGVADLTKRLLAWSTYRAPKLRDGRPRQKTDPLSASALAPLCSRGPTDRRMPFFQRLMNIVAKGRQDHGRDLNFEQLIHACDELARALPNEPDREDRSRWMLEPFFRLRRRHAAWGSRRVPLMMSLIAEEARYFILDAVAEKCAAPAVLDVYNGLKRLGDQYRLRIHSLNYDDLALQTGLDLYTGFDERTGRFIPDYPWPADKHSLAQLHGSVRWGWSDSAEIRAFDSLATARSHRGNRMNQRLSQDGHAFPVGPMVTGLRKADLILERPYGTYFHVFREQLLTTPLWLIIGYGFGDPHVNRTLQQAWANWTQRGQATRVVVVDHLASDGRNLVESGAAETRGWAKIRMLLEPSFREALEKDWHRRRTCQIVSRGLFRFAAESGLAVQLDGGVEAMTTGFNEIAEFLGT